MTETSIFLDYNSTTPLDPEVQAEMQRVQELAWANPSSVHGAGRAARKVLEDARERVAQELGCDPGEVYFTSGGTESDHLAIKGCFYANPGRSRRLIVSTVEHPAVLAAADDLRAAGAEIVRVGVDGSGVVRTAELSELLATDTLLVSVMAANNETGTLQPIPELTRACREAGAVFHTDAVQAIGKIPVNVRDWGVDMLSLTAHKFYGPRGVGALFVRRGVALAPQITGGSQERKRRAGTENVVGAWGLAVALERANAMMAEETKRLHDLTEHFLDGLKAAVSDVHVNGSETERVANTLNMSFPGVEGESIVVSLDLKSIHVASGSACSSGATEPSHAILALGIDPNLAAGAVRISLGRQTTRAHMDRLLAELPPIVERLRQLSPTYARNSA